MKPKVFTVEEANALLPELNLRLERILHKRDAHARHHDAIFMEQILVQAEGHTIEESLTGDLEREVQFMESNIVALEAELEAIRHLGCILRSLEKGFVDFLAKQNGNWIYLCWQRGEDKIRYYHSVERGSAKRLLLTDHAGTS